MADCQNLPKRASNQEWMGNNEDGELDEDLGVAGIKSRRYRMT